MADYATIGVKTQKNHGIITPCLQAKLVKDGNPWYKSKTISLKSHSENEAWEIAVLWCEKIAKEEGVEFRIPNKSSTIGNAKRAYARVGVLSKNIDLLASSEAFKKLVSDAFNVLGEERVKRTLDAGFKHYDNLKREHRQKTKAKQDATTIVAQSLYQAYKQTGVDMSATITDKDVLAMYNELVNPN